MSVARLLLISVAFIVSCAEMEKKDAYGSTVKWEDDSNNFSENWRKAVVTQECWLRRTPNITGDNMIKALHIGTELLIQEETKEFSSAYAIPEIGFISRKCFKFRSK